jgi:predicted phosphodiesterase
LHLGALTRVDVLRDERHRASLIARLHSVDRLVLLGDVLELRQARLHDVLEQAIPVLAGLGAALGPEKEVVIVPGNHDHHLLSGWLERRSASAAEPLGLSAEVDWEPGEPLSIIAEAVAPTRMRVSYPGTWLRKDVYATHGHYLDRHTTVPMFERLGAGVMARIVGERDGGPRRTEDYEAILAPIYAWIHALAQSGGPQLGRSSHGASRQAWRALASSGRNRGLRTRALNAGFPVAVALLSRTPLGPLHADISAPELRRAALLAFGAVLARTRVDADHVIFGHTHRAGPLPDDDRGEWSAPTGARLLNAGCWIHEPAFLGARPAGSPYRPGFGALLAATGEPELQNLLTPIPA